MAEGGPIDPDAPAVTGVLPPADPYAGLPWPPPGWGMPLRSMTEYPIAPIVIGSIPDPTAPRPAQPAPPPPAPPPPKKIDELPPARPGSLPALPYAPPAAAPDEETPTVTTEPRQPTEGSIAPPGGLGTAAEGTDILQRPPTFQSLPPPALPYDAISGPGAATQQDAESANVARVEAQRQFETRLPLLKKWAADPLNPQAGADLTNEERGQLLLRMSPEERAGYEAKRAAIQQNDMLAEQARVSREHMEREQQAWQAHLDARAAAQAESDKMTADAIALAKQPPQSWMDTRTTFQALAAGISAVAGSLGVSAGYKGGNVGLDMMNHAMQLHMEQERMRLEQQRAVLGIRATSAREKMQAADEDYRALTVHNLALHQAALEGIQTEMQQFDPNGTIVQKYADTYAAVAAQQQAIKQAYDQQQFKNKIDAANAGLKVREQEEKDRHDVVTERREAWEASIKQQEANQKQAEHVVHPKEYYASTYGAENAPPTDMSEAQYARYITAKGQTTEAKAKGKALLVPTPAPVTTKDAQGNVVTHGAVLTDSHGRTDWALTPEDAKLSKETMKASIGLTQALDRLDEVRTRKGWSSDLAKSDDWQRAWSNYETAVQGFMELKGFKRYTEADAEAMGRVLGNLKDPTRVQDITAGIQEARAIVERDLNAQLAVSGYDLPVKLPKTAGGPAPQQSVVGYMADKISQLDAAENKDTPGFSKEIITKGVDRIYAIASGTATGDDKRQAQDPAARAEALAILREWASNGITDTIRDRSAGYVKTIDSELPSVEYPHGQEPGAQVTQPEGKP